MSEAHRIAMLGTGFIADLPSNVGLFTQNDAQESDAQEKNSANQLSVGQLIVKHQQGKITKALVHPKAACIYHQYGF